MKKTVLLLLFFAAALRLGAQHEIMLHLAPRTGNSVFALDQAIDHPGGTYQLKFTRFEYYISEIKITHDGGQITPCPDRYLLVHPALDSMYSLGQLPDVQNVEAITFSVGVPQAVNHLDPAVYPAGHPLSPQNPSMHWGWTAGYRFAAIEGVAGTNFSQSFEIHALGDGNYKTQTLVASAEQVDADTRVIHLRADYTQSLKNVNVSGGLVVHGATGAAITVLNNFKNVVFTAAASAVTDPAFRGAFSVWPNPAQGAAPTAYFSLPAGHDYLLTVTDLSGKTILNRVLPAADNQSASLDAGWQPGLYFVHLWQDGRPVAIEKLVVLK